MVWVGTDPTAAIAISGNYPKDEGGITSYAGAGQSNVTSYAVPSSDFFYRAY